MILEKLELQFRNSGYPCSLVIDKDNHRVYLRVLSIYDNEITGLEIFENNNNLEFVYDNNDSIDFKLDINTDFEIIKQKIISNM